MSQADPIVNTEEKELAVPQFTKLEIIKIVNDAIENGDIELSKTSDQKVPTILKGEYVGNETAFNKKHKVGDIVIEISGFVGIIKSISFDGDNLNSIEISGLENDNTPTTYIYADGSWTNTESTVGE